MVQYRIEWRYNHTNYTGNGDWFEEKDKELLEGCIEYYNKEYQGDIYHWLVTK